MALRTSPWPDGVPCWVDLVTPDVAAARAFYSAVLGWRCADTSAQYGGYVVASVRGGAAAGIGPLPAPDLPSTWTVYVASSDADASATAVLAHGGSVLLHPGDVGPLGRMLVAADPTGAAFGVWQAGSHRGCGVVDEPGALVWADLRSTDPDAARAFYTGVFGYRDDPAPDAGPGCSTFSLAGDGTPLGGMGGMRSGGGRDPHWLVHFGVAAVDAAAHAALAGGGSVLTPAFDSPYGRVAGLADPAGALFWVLETDGRDARRAG